MHSLSSYLKLCLLPIGLGIIFLSAYPSQAPESVQKTRNLNPFYQDGEACNCGDNWFPHARTPAPEEGVGSPFDTSSTTNCIFHQWSWQKFLWLTKPQENGKPLFLNEMVQVSDVMMPVDNPLQFPLVLQYTEQAGSNGILKTNSAYKSDNDADHTLMYSIHISDTLQVAAEAYKTALSSGDLPVSNKQTFPVASLEMKVSWVNIEALPEEKRTDYFTTTAGITKDGKSFVKQTVALLGMHVVGVVINHPEFIWATFLHDDVAPDYDWESGTGSSNSEKLIYATGSTTGLDGITWDTTTKAPILANKAYDLFQYGIPRSKGGGFMTTSQEEPVNFNNLESINACVSDSLSLTDDVWANYFYDGSIWINTDGLTAEEQADTLVTLGGSIADATKGSIARGCLNNANVTMETFTQTFESGINDINASTLANCLSCHNAVQFGDTKPYPTSPLYISHIFNGYVLYHSGKSIPEINALKDRAFVAQFIKTRK